MQDNLIFQGKTYISSKRAAKYSGYTPDYIGQLCRGKKLDCRMIGRTWYVTSESLKTHKSHVSEVEASPQRIRNLIKDYKRDDRPLLPELHKFEAPTQPVPAPAATPVAAPIFVPAANAVMEETIQSKPTVSIQKRKSWLRPSLAIGMFVIAITIGIYIYMIPIASFDQTIKRYETAGSGAALGSTSAALKPATSTPAITQQSGKDWNGIAVVPPSSNSELVKKQIQEAFSDEVRVEPDKSNTAGVITPVFRTATGKDFVYVLVPVKKKTP